MKKVFTLIALASILSSGIDAKAISNKGFRADMTFMDFEELTSLFKPHHKQTVHVIRHSDSPLKVLEAEVSDRGTVFFRGLSGTQNTYSVKVQNNSNRKILAYEVTWVLKHPFEDYVFHKMHTNSIEPVEVGESQTLKFRRSKHYRDDAYYYVEISKVEFDDDESIWEAPDLDSYKKHSRLDAVKKEIDAMEDDVEMIDDEALKMLKEKYREIDDEDFEGRVILKEYSDKKPTLKTPEKTEIRTETVELEEIKTETVESTTIETKSQTIIPVENLESEVIKSNVSSQEPILDPQELMKAVDDIIRLKKEENLVLESDLVESKTDVIQTIPVSETTIIDTKPISETKSVVKTTVTETKPVETKSMVKTTVIETKPIETKSFVKTKTIETVKEVVEDDDDYDDDFEDFDDDEDFDDFDDDDDFVDFGDDDFDDDF